MRQDLAPKRHLLLPVTPDLLALRRLGLAVTLRGIGQHQMQHAFGILRRKGACHQRSKRMPDQNDLPDARTVQHGRQRVGVIPRVGALNRQHRAFAITGHVPRQHAKTVQRHLFMPGGSAGADAVEQHQRDAASLFTKARHRAPLVPLHFRQRVIGRIGRDFRLVGAEHHAHQRLFFTMIEQTAIDARRNGDQIAFAQHGFGVVIAVLDHQRDLPFKHEEHLFHIIMQMQWSLALRRQHHGGEGKVLSRHGIGIACHARRPGTDVAHLRTAVFRIEIGLELQRVPVIFTPFKARNARLDPLFHGQMVRFNAWFCSYG
ncbi:hypothetical protein EcWSU1_03726 [Enterobacter ludwigii]|uniref:Uncharacterized protein n=1 Tax=Enterobacter ludwigii TaxID=299767 RepID=G8LDW1_9ENTR|nr:hypothetical protein EcWSU1_03726 [Enterobacter ludwigii]